MRELRAQESANRDIIRPLSVGAIATEKANSVNSKKGLKTKLKGVRKSRGKF